MRGERVLPIRMLSPDPSAETWVIMFDPSTSTNLRIRETAEESELYVRRTNSYIRKYLRRYFRTFVPSYLLFIWKEIDTVRKYVESTKVLSYNVQHDVVHVHVFYTSMHTFVYFRKYFRTFVFSYENRIPGRLLLGSNTKVRK